MINEIIGIISALKSPPVDITTCNGCGVVQGKLTKILLINPALIIKYDTNPVIVADNTNGIARIGFKTTGVPNIIGSQIKNVGTITAFPTALYAFTLEKNK